MAVCTGSWDSFLKIWNWSLPPPSLHSLVLLHSQLSFFPPTIPSPSVRPPASRPVPSPDFKFYLESELNSTRVVGVSLFIFCYYNTRRCFRIISWSLSFCFWRPLILALGSSANLLESLSPSPSSPPPSQPLFPSPKVRNNPPTKRTSWHSFCLFIVDKALCGSLRVVNWLRTAL